MHPLAIEILAAAFGLLGTTVLAMNGKRAGWGFVAFLASNAGWLAFAYQGAHWFMFAQQVGFTVTSFLGIWRWLLRRRVEVFIGHYRVARRYAGIRQALSIAWEWARLLP
jgi:hypothetical protein